MKTLILNGSPRKNGDTVRLIELFREKSGFDCTVFRICEKKIAPCTDCRFCHTHPSCALWDDMEEFWRELSDAELILLASPICFGQPSPQLLSWASRLQFAFVSERIRKDPDFSIGKRRGALLFAAGGGTKNLEPAIRTGKEVLRFCGADCVGPAAAMNSDRIPAEQDLQAKKSVETLIQLLVSSAK